MPGTSGWPWADGPAGTPVIRQALISGAWAHMAAPTSEVSTSCPRPVRSRTSSAARTPATMFCEPRWSTIVAPTGDGSLPAPPIVLISPPAAWPPRSAPSRRVLTPFDPYDEPERVDHARVACRGCGVADAPLVERARLEVGDHHVRPLGQAEEHLGPCRRAQVDRDAALGAVAGEEVRRAVVGQGDRQPARRVADLRQLDLDHVGTPLGQRRRSLRALHQQPALDDLDPLQRCTHDTSLPLDRRPTVTPAGDRGERGRRGRATGNGALPPRVVARVPPGPAGPAGAPVEACCRVHICR